MKPPPFWSCFLALVRRDDSFIFLRFWPLYPSRNRQQSRNNFSTNNLYFSITPYLLNGSPNCSRALVTRFQYFNLLFPYFSSFFHNDCTNATLSIHFSRYANFCALKLLQCISLNDNDSLDLRDITLENYSREPTLMHHYFRLNEYMKARSVKYQ